MLLPKIFEKINYLLYDLSPKMSYFPYFKQNFSNRMPQNKIFRERKRRPEPLEQLDSTLTGEDTRDVNEILDDDPMEQDIMGSFSPPSEISQNSQDHFTTDDNNSTIDVPSENGETLVKKITITFDMATCGKL